MQFEIFAARRLMRSTRRGTTGRPRGVGSLLSLSVVGVALSLVVMLLSLSIIQGFRRQISSIAYSQTGHISLYPWGSSWTSTGDHTMLSDRLLGYLRDRDDVAGVYPILQQMSLLKTEEDFAGVMLYGVDSAFGYRFFREAISEGTMPSFGFGDSINPIVLPSKVAERMGLGIGDKVRLYFTGDRVRVRAYTIAGIYDSHGLEDMPALCSYEFLRRLESLPEGSYSRAIIELKGSDALADAVVSLSEDLIHRPEILGEMQFALSTAEELMPDLFQWLTLLDSNVVFLIVIMLIVGAFTMITGLIVIVLDKTEHIGLLKAIGASTMQVRRVFTLITIRQISIGLVAGNAMALVLSWIQIRWQVIKLDPHNYFMDAVPVHLDPLLWLGVNVGTLLFITLSILGPTMIVARIRPADIMRID